MSGVISSINTNSSAMIALNSLNNISSEMQTAQTAVSTGYRVSGAVQDGAAFAVAQSVRSSVSGLTSANEQLGGVQGLLGAATSGLTDVSNLMSVGDKSLQATLNNLSSNSLSTSTRSQYISQYQSVLTNIQNDLNHSDYQGRNLISGTTSAASGTFGNVNVVSNEVGSQFTIKAFAGTTTYNALNVTATVLGSATQVRALISATGSFSTAVNTVGTGLNTLGNDTNLVSNQITFNSNKIDALNNGIGSLIDTNMAAESAKLQSLQIQQQLATSALSMANQAPSLLTKLFP